MIRAYFAVIGFLATLIFGLWLSRKRKPYNGVLFNIHKLVALGTLIISALQVYTMIKTVAPQPLIVPWLVIAAISILAMFVSGAFMSIGDKNYDILRTVHNIAPAVAAVTMEIVFFLIEGVL